MDMRPETEAKLRNVLDATTEAVQTFTELLQLGKRALLVVLDEQERELQRRRQG